MFTCPLKFHCLLSVGTRTTDKSERRCLMPKGEALPARPSLEFLKKLAKQQFAALRRQGRMTSLASAQLTSPRKYGFPSWRKLKAHVELLERAAAAVQAISSGDTKTLKRLLRQNSNLANTRVDDKRTLLHVATDWPGHFPNNTETIAELILTRLRNCLKQTGNATLVQGDVLEQFLRRAVCHGTTEYPDIRGKTGAPGGAHAIRVLSYGLPRKSDLAQTFNDASQKSASRRSRLISSKPVYG
jgi:hypothetical protein